MCELHKLSVTDSTTICWHKLTKDTMRFHYTKSIHGMCGIFTIMWEYCIACPMITGNQLMDIYMSMHCFHNHVRCTCIIICKNKLWIPSLCFDKRVREWETSNQNITRNRKGCLWSHSKLVRTNLSNAVIFRERMRTSRRNNRKDKFLPFFKFDRKEPLLFYLQTPFITNTCSHKKACCASLPVCSKECPWGRYVLPW